MGHFFLWSCFGVSSCISQECNLNVEQLRASVCNSFGALEKIQIEQLILNYSPRWHGTRVHLLVVTLFGCPLASLSPRVPTIGQILHLFNIFLKIRTWHFHCRSHKTPSFPRILNLLPTLGGYFWLSTAYGENFMVKMNFWKPCYVYLWKTSMWQCLWDGKILWVKETSKLTTRSLIKFYSLFHLFFPPSTTHSFLTLITIFSTQIHFSQDDQLTDERKAFQYGLSHLAKCSMWNIWTIAGSSGILWTFPLI